MCMENFANQLYRTLRSTIVERLRRLVRKKWVIRKRKGKQFVIYRLAEDKVIVWVWRINFKMIWSNVNPQMRII